VRRERIGDQHVDRREHADGNARLLQHDHALASGPPLRERIHAGIADVYAKRCDAKHDKDREPGGRGQPALAHDRGTPRGPAAARPGLVP
jgi:hypothetical protein